MRWSALVLLALPSAAHPQDRCSWRADRQYNVQAASGQYNTYLGGSVVMNCPSKQVRLRSDSLESSGDQGRVHVIGNVHYAEPRFTIDSDVLTYTQHDERIVATGNVRAAMPDGSTLNGPFAEYERVIPARRPARRVLATGRPNVTIIQRDSAGVESPPMTVVANHITMVGDSLVYAGGNVVARREDLTARGDSMALDNQSEFLRMMREPVIEGRGERPFTLTGAVIDLTSSQRKLERVFSQGQATALSEDMTLASDSIDFRINDDLLERAIAWGPGRARANSPTQQIVADSIDVSMPAQRVREMYAVRGAVAEGRPDSTRFRPDTVDWLRGDTIVALFDTLPLPTARAPGDTAQSTRIRELTAHGNAKSYYQLPPADSAERRPAISYVTGREIVVNFSDQQVSRVTVHQQTGGVYLEPKRQTSDEESAESTPPAQTRPSRTPAPTRRPRSR